MAKPKRGGQVPPTPAGEQWDLRYGTKESLGFEELCRQFPGNGDEAKQRLRNTPLTRSAEQKPLKGELGSRVLKGVSMPQWQYDMSSAARVWYCVDEDNHIVWLTLASFGHPKATQTKRKRAPRRK